MTEESTIAAIATPPGIGGVGIIRISGDNATSIAAKLWSKDITKYESHRCYYGSVVSADSSPIDDGLLIFMKKPNSYTGEDVIELQLHGGEYILQRALARCIECGATPAGPGEFTKRAFLNGKLSLSQAEAVMDVISSENEYARKSAVAQMNGIEDKKLRIETKKLLNKMAEIEVALDDPEHFSMEEIEKSFIKELTSIKESVDNYISTAGIGRYIKNGINTAIIGKPNVGKSTLLNNLVGYERAIVTSVEGTTRDTIEESIRLKNISINLIDTAGIRSSTDEVEKLGIDRTNEAIAKAELILFVVDASRPIDEKDKEIFNQIYDKKTIIIYNKIDINKKADLNDLGKIDTKYVVEISAKNGEGLKDIGNLVEKMFFEHEIDFNNQVIITNERHILSLKKASDAIARVIDAINSGISEDVYMVDLMEAYENLGDVTGETAREDLADEIFSKFCVGK